MASSTSSPYVAGPGPGFDPSKPPPAAPPAGEEPDLAVFAPAWEERQVHDWLLNAGDMAHSAWGVAERDWAMTKADLERIAPPLARILNRYEPTRMVAAYSDPAAVAMGMGMYGWRSMLERSQVLKARRAQEGPGPPPAQAPDADGELDAQAPPGTTWADQLKATRPPEQ